jgi:hypothetical protein
VRNLTYVVLGYFAAILTNLLKCFFLYRARLRVIPWRRGAYRIPSLFKAFSSSGVPSLKSLSLRVTHSGPCGVRTGLATDS